MANTYHDQLNGTDLHPNKIDATTGTELTAASQAIYDGRYHPKNSVSGLQNATSTQTGVLSSVDWSKFNGKGFKTAVVVGPSGSTGNDYTGDGLADQVAIQAAINVVAANGGGVVYLREGTYNIAATIALKNNVVLMGCGYATRLLAANAMTAIIYNSNASPLLNASLRDLRLDANNISPTSCMQVAWFNGFTLSNVWCTNVNHVWSLNLGNWTTSEASSKSTRLTVRDLVVDTVVNTTLEPFIIVNTDYFRLDNLTFRNCAVTLTASLSIYVNCRHGVVSSCTFIDSVDQQVQLNLTASDNIAVLGNTFKWLGTNGANGITIYNCASVVISGNTMDNIQSGFGGAGVTVRDWNGGLDGHPNPYPNSSDITITDNHFNGGYYGIVFTSDDLASKNLAQSDVIIAGNKIRDITYCGILVGDSTKITGDVTNFNIQDNIIQSRISGDAHLILLQGNATYKLKEFIVSGNRLHGRGGNNASGINADYLVNSTIQGNRITAKGSRSPIQSTNDDGLTISGNTLVPAGSTAPLTLAGVNAIVRNNGGVSDTTTKTAAYTLIATDSIILGDATTAAFTVTLPSAVGIAGRQYTIKRTNSGSNNVTVTTTSSQTIDGASTKTLGGQFSYMTVVSDGAGWQVVGQGGTVS